MSIVLIIAALVFLLAGFLGAIIPVIPGPPLGFIGLLLLRWSGYGNFSTEFLVIWAVICVAVTVMDYILPAIFTRRFGGSKAAVAGSVFGLIIGMIFFAPLGIIIGPFIGAFLGELLNFRINKSKREEKEQGLKALYAALGAFLAFIAGTGAKLITGAMMIYYAAKSVIETIAG